MNKFFKIIIVLFSCFLLPTLYASSGIVSDSEGLNLRESPTVDSDRIHSIKYNDAVEILEDKLYKGNGCDAGWYKVSHNNITGFVCSSYLNIINNTEGFMTGDYKAKVNTASYVNVRQTPTTSSTLLDKLITGTSVIINSKHSGPGCNKQWYNITYHDGKKGYVCGEYISTKEELTLNEKDYKQEEKTIANSLINDGFPKTYIPYLMKMKRNHPKWNFKPVNKSLKWKDVIDNEELKNKIESTTTTVLNYFTVKNANASEGGRWFYTNNYVNAFFIDPRNFLSDNFIFMFEELSYNSDFHTKDAIKDIFGNTYLSSDEYVEYFINAASTYNISPLHLASRVYKEGAANPNYGPVTGTYDKEYKGCNLKGYYNFYNIGSYSNWEDGLYYATGSDCYAKDDHKYNRPWKTKESAILGGAQFISESYIKDGQDTIYFQKFNTSTPNYYTHQYMTNIMAPTQEGERIYMTLKDLKLLDNSYTFKIPVYLDMPDTISLPNIADNDASIKSITINGKTIDDFDPDVTEYIYYIKNNVENALIDVEVNKSTAVATYNKNISLGNEDNKVKIEVKAQNGNTKTYNINIIKTLGVNNIEEIISSLSIKVTGEYMKNISVNTFFKSLERSIRKADPNATVTIKDKNLTEINKNEKLSTGQILTIKSTNGEEKTFKIVVKGDVNGDGDITILDLLKVQKHLLNSSKLTSSYLEASDTNDSNDTTILDLLRIQKHLLNVIKL